MLPSRFIVLAFALCLCAAPGAHAQQAPATLRIDGSNTMGARLIPALVAGLFEAQGLRDITVQTGARENEQSVSATGGDGQRVNVAIAAHGSSTGFADLHAGLADLAAASRPIRADERQLLKALGDMTTPQAEHIVAIDGVAVIVHPDNPLRQISTEQLAQLFAGELPDWQALGGQGPVHLYARDERSGTWETFRDLVLQPRGKTLAAGAQRLESSEQLAEHVAKDPLAIGFVGLPSVRDTRALAIADGQSLAMAPLRSLIASEDYPLSRRLFFYTAPDDTRPWVQALLRFTQSERGQAIVAAQGFVAQTVSAMPVSTTASAPPVYRELAASAQRLSVTFRFAAGSAQLDNKARLDVQRVQAYLQRHGKRMDQVSLVGFGDARHDSERAQLLSRLRAMAVRRELVKGEGVLRAVIGLGAELPVATNAQDEGRIKNRRVEVWVH